MGKVRLNNKEMRALDKLIKQLDDNARKGKPTAVRNDLNLNYTYGVKQWQNKQD